MKKKEYITPEIHVVLLHMQQRLLTGSGTDVYTDKPADGGTQLSRMDEEFDLDEDDFDIDEDVDY